MKKYIYSLIAVFTIGLCSAQISLAQAEYFWDTDPGEGNATALLATDGNFGSAFEQFFQNGISVAQPIGLHTYNVRIKDSTGVWGPVFKNVIYIETALATENVSLAKIKAYPNPVKDILNISYDKKITDVSVYNLSGQKVVTKSINSNEGKINMSGLSSGIYLVKINADNSVKTIKIIKK